MAGVSLQLMRVLLQLDRLVLSGGSKAWGTLVSIASHLVAGDGDRLHRSGVLEPDIHTTTPRRKVAALGKRQ